MTAAFVRRLWLGVGSIVTVVVLLFVTASFANAVARDVEEVHRTVRSEKAPAAVVLVVDHGAVDIVAGDGSHVEITGTVSHGLQRTTFDAELVGSSLEITTHCPVLSVWCYADLRVEVPRSVAVEADIDDGLLAVTGVDGGVRTRGRDGGVELTSVGGVVDVETRNGEVVGTALRAERVRADTRNGRIRLLFEDAPDTVRAHTLNGPVDVGVPAGDDYHVDLATRHGRTTTGVRTDPDGRRSISASTRNGDVAVHYVAD